MVRAFICYFLITGYTIPALSQCGSISVSAPSMACKNELFRFQNNTTASQYEWDYCTGDLMGAPVPFQVSTPPVNRPFDIEVVQDHGLWYGFVIGYSSNSITRVDFGTSLQNLNPVYNNLGNPGGLLGNPTSMRMIKQGLNWFGLVFSQQSSSIVLLNFGTSIENVNTTASLAATSVGGIEGALDVANNGGNSFVVLVSDNSGTVSTLPFPNGLDQPHGTVGSMSVGGYLVDIQIVKNCNSWSVFLLRLNTQNIVRLDYGGDLTSTPTTNFYPANQFGFSPYRFWIGKEGDYAFGLVSNLAGGIASLDIGLNLNNSNPVVIDHGNLGVLSSNWSIFAAKQTDQWTAYTLDGNTSGLFRLNFPNNACGANPQFSSNQDPGLISYATQGQKFPVLKVVYSNGITESKTLPVLVQNLTATPLGIDQGSNLCVISPFSFSPQTKSSPFSFKIKV